MADIKNKSGLSGPSDLGSHDQLKNKSNPPYSHPNSKLSKPQAVDPKLGGYKVFCDKGDYQKGGASVIHGVSATDLASKPGPGSSVGITKGPSKTKGDDYD
jgi:hypothetical protein